MPVLAAFAASACTNSSGANGNGPSEDELRSGYQDLASVFVGQDSVRWNAVETALRQGFDRVCGDTICSGDYGHLTTVLFQCSATSSAKKLGECVWVLGDSIDDVDTKTGKVHSDARVFTCKIPVSSSPKEMLDVLSSAGQDALQTSLPGSQGSFYDALTSCLQGVTGNPPPNFEAGPFVELGDELDGKDEALADSWWETKTKLNQAFDVVCGDSFCGGEFQDISGLRFSCGLDTSTDKVRSCSWSFARANTTIGAGGAITAETSTKSCEVAIDTDPRTLVETLAQDPLNTSLPGKSSSIYDALVGCL